MRGSLQQHPIDPLQHRPTLKNASALELPDRVVAQRKSKKVTYYSGAATSQLIGQLFIQVIRSPHHDLVSKWCFDTPNGGILFRIWPPSKG
jgi:hypothetical protein